MRRMSALTPLGFVILIALFGGVAIAQNIDQAALCALEGKLVANEIEFLRQVGAENNPIKKSTLEQQLRQLRLNSLRTRLDFVGVKYTFLPGNGAFLNVHDGNTFDNFFGKVELFRAEGLGDFALNVLADCALRRLLLRAYFKPARWVVEPTSVSNLDAMRASLGEINLGNSVLLSGRLGFDLPGFSNNETAYTAKVTAIKKK
jgi:hypothetical protein